MSSSVFSHAVRVLICEQCGAPLEAEIGGGTVKCQYCGTTSQLVERDESLDLAEAAEAEGSDISESERVQQLRAQDDQPLLPPPSLQQLLRGHELDPKRETEARQEWQAARKRLEGGGGFTAAERLFHLTLLLAPVSEGKKERALLENGLEILPDARHRQVIRCRLAKKAVVSGDLEAATQWLRPSNPRPTDLYMDTSYRLAAAYVAFAKGEPMQVLNLLGDNVDDIPIADGYDSEAAFLRVAAVEQTVGADKASAQLEVLLQQDVRRLAAFEVSYRENEPLSLCKTSWSALHKRALARLEADYRGVLTGLALS